MTSTGSTAAASRRAGRARRTSESPGDFEAHVGAHIVPQPESEGGCWTYHGRLNLAEVRAFTVGTLTDIPLDPDTRFRATCGTAGCVRPPHLDRTGADT